MELKDVFAVGGTGITAMFTIICSTGMVQILLYNPIKNMVCLYCNIYNCRKHFDYTVCSIRSVSS